MRTRIPLLASLLTLAPLGAADFVAAGDPPLERLPLTADDIAGVTGLNLYKFRVAMEPATAFSIDISVQDTPDAKPRIVSRYAFTADDDAEAVELRLSFLPMDDSLRGVLLSQDEEVTYRINGTNCSPSGLATVIALPLREIPGTRETLMAMNAEVSSELSDENEVCLIAVLASPEGEPPSTRKSYPRAKVSVRLNE